MSEGGFGVEVVTPEAVLRAGEATEVVLRTSEGELAVLDGHTPLVGDVVPGVVRVRGADDTVEAFVVHGGFLQVATAPGAAAGLLEGVADDERTTRVTVLAGVAEAVASIDVPRAEAARDATTAALSQLAARDDEAAAYEREALERALARATARLEAAAAPAPQ